MKKLFSKFSYPTNLWIQKGERNFLSFVVVAFILAMFATPYPQLGMWVGFIFAAYAAVANDSIQTLGTFIASNQDKKWWVLWIFIGGIFLATMTFSWTQVDETGITVFYEKIDKSEESHKKLNKKFEKDILVPFFKENKSDIVTNLQSNYNNVDYGACFFFDKKLNQIYTIDSIGIESKEETYYKYNQVYYSNGNTKLNVDFSKLGYKLFPNGFVDRDVSHGRLSSKNFEQSPINFHFLQIAAPIFLLILTRLRMPVSTTFILLTSFAAAPSAIGQVLAKSMSGYVLAFFLGFIIFVLISKWAKRYFVGKAKFGWTIAQWITSGTLWSVWLMQDAANIAVYLPRSMSSTHFIGFAGVVFVGLGMLLFFKGGRIQKIVTEKSVVTDVRFATIIDFIYCIILFYFKLYSNVPMSTTWVFIGLLGGREIAMAIRNSGENNKATAIKLLVKDFSYALIGLLISIAIAIGVNDQLTFSSMLAEIPAEFASGIKKFFTRLLFF